MASRADQIIADAVRQAQSRQTGGGDYGTSSQPMTGEEALLVAQRAFNSWLGDTANPISSEFSKIKEKAEILDGTRSNQSLAKAAVRFQDLRALLAFPSRPPGWRQLNTTPTADDYNALYNDVKAIYQVLGTIAVVVGNFR